MERGEPAVQLGELGFDLVDAGLIGEPDDVAVAEVAVDAAPALPGLPVAGDAAAAAREVV